MRKKVIVGEETGAGKSRKKMLPRGKEKKKSLELFLLPRCSWIADPFSHLLCSCNTHIQVLYLKHLLWSLQGRVGWHLPGGAPGRTGRLFLVQFQPR